MKEEFKEQSDISDLLLKQAMEQIKDLEADQALANPPTITNEMEVQTEVEYPIASVTEKIVEVEVIKEVEIIREVPVIKEVIIREDSDKIDDTDITLDSSGHFQIFEQKHNPDDPSYPTMPR